MIYGFDRVIVSSDEYIDRHHLYLDFWPFVAYAYRTLFPGVRVTLAFVSERHEDSAVVAALREHGDVVLVPRQPRINSGVQAKFARYWVAARCDDDEIVYIDDIDQIPIDREWHIRKVAPRKPDHMLFVGAEVYEHDRGPQAVAGQVPASQMTAESHVWRHLFGVYDSLSFGDFLRSMERPGYSLDAAQTPEQFSDEKLIAVLKREPSRAVQETHVRRDYQPGVDTIDRSFVPQFSLEKLDSGGYIASHMPRPYQTYREINDATFEYIQRRYNGGPLPAPLVW